MLLLPPKLWAASLPGLSDDYNVYFQWTSERFLKRDWRQLKAQGIQESRLDPHAKSPAGAMGIMQFMPRTWTECTLALGLNASPYNPQASIICGGWYMARMDRIWDRRGRTDNQVWQLALASYNAGPGSILKAQARCNDAPTWDEIYDCLYLITGLDNSMQTVRYVVLVPQRYYRMQN